MNLKSNPRTSRALSRLTHSRLIVFSLSTLLWLLAMQPSHAGSATWSAIPISGDWNTAANWIPATVPNGASDTATFAISNLTNVSISAFTTLDGITFDPQASAFTISNGSQVVEMFGAGITNNSGITQNFVIPNFEIFFFNKATAGNRTVFTMSNDVFQSGSVAFVNESTAGTASFIMLGGAANHGQGGYVVFENKATAADGAFATYGASVDGAVGGFILFEDTSSAGNATIVNNDSPVIGGGGLTLFLDDSTGEKARLKMIGQGKVNIIDHNSPGVTVGSIEGNGFVSLGMNTLTVGTNDLSTTFSGLIQDGIIGGAGGALVKIGYGQLTLKGANTYTGSTTVRGGTLLVNNMTGSGTGSGPVQIAAGTLAGNGTMTGPVIVASATVPAMIAPGGEKKFGTLTTLSLLTLNSLARCEIDLNSVLGIADQLVANGVTINSGAKARIVDPGTGTLSTGTVFTIINNTATTPITGTFSNLADGSTLTLGSNNYQVSYEGGDGNDLTLTVQ